MNANIKKKAIAILDKSGRITVRDLAKSSSISKEAALRILEEMKNKDGLLIMDYSDELERVYTLAMDLKIEQRDLLEDLRA